MNPGLRARYKLITQVHGGKDVDHEALFRSRADFVGGKEAQSTLLPDIVFRSKAEHQTQDQVKAEYHDFMRQPGHKVRVTLAYEVQYPDPLRVSAGDPVSVGREDPEFPGWKWCKGPEGTRRLGSCRVALKRRT